MHRKKIFIFFSLLALMTLAPSQGQCENWKEFFKDGDGTYYYDKDSIHYPHLKKNIFGLIVRNKEIVNVWTRETRRDWIGDAYLLTIYCAIRKYDVQPDPLDLNTNLIITPGHTFESLLKKVCP